MELPPPADSNSPHRYNVGVAFSTDTDSTADYSTIDTGRTSSTLNTNLNSELKSMHASSTGGASKLNAMTMAYLSTYGSHIGKNATKAMGSSSASSSSSSGGDASSKAKSRRSLDTGSDKSVIGNIVVQTPYNNLNPFRKSGSTVVTHSRSIPRQLNHLDPLDYKDDLYVKRAGGLTVCIKPDVTMSDKSLPSRSEVTDTLVDLTRKGILSYNTRIVGVGACIKAMKDPRHLTPGLQCILDLHRTFIDVSQINPNPWLLDTHQILQIMKSKIPWMSDDALNRLINSFDPQKTGMVRFVRISLTLVACLQPAMIELASMFNRVRDRVRMYEQKDREELDRLAGELIIIRLLHTLYEDCAGGVEWKMEWAKPPAKEWRPKTADLEAAEAAARVGGDGCEDSGGDGNSNSETDMGDGSGSGSNYNENGTSSKGGSSSADNPHNKRTMVQVGVGMKFEDINELFACSVTNIDDELRIDRAIKPMLDHLYADSQRQDDVVATHFAKNENGGDDDMQSGIHSISTMSTYGTAIVVDNTSSGM